MQISCDVLFLSQDPHDIELSPLWGHLRTGTISETFLASDDLDSFFKITFYWSIVDLQCCISFCLRLSDSVLCIYRFFFFSFLSFFLSLFLVALGLCCCTWAFSSCGERGLLFVVVRGLLIAVASLVAEHGL